MIGMPKVNANCQIHHIPRAGFKISIFNQKLSEFPLHLMNFRERAKESVRERESQRAYVSVRVWMNFGNFVIVNNNNNMRAQTISQQQIYQTTIYTISLIEFELIPIWRMGQVMHNT